MSISGDAHTKPISYLNLTRYKAPLQKIIFFL